jgi:hypothetical protein
MKRTRLKRRGGLGVTPNNSSGSPAAGRIRQPGRGPLLGPALAGRGSTSCSPTNDEEALNTALDHLYSTEARAYDELADSIESRAECAAGAFPEHDVVLIAAPVLAWSRYRIPAAAVAARGTCQPARPPARPTCSPRARLAVADFLFSPDQLPQGYCATAEFATHLGAAATTTTCTSTPTGMPETAQFLSDTRYLLGAVVVPRAPPSSAGRKDGSRDAGRWSNGAPRAAPAWPRCCRAARSTWCCPNPISPPAAPPTRTAAPTRCAPRWPSWAPRSRLRPPTCAPSSPPSGTATSRNTASASPQPRQRPGGARRGVALLGAEDESSRLALAQIEAVLRESGINDVVISNTTSRSSTATTAAPRCTPHPRVSSCMPKCPKSTGEQMPRHLH